VERSIPSTAVDKSVEEAAKADLNVRLEEFKALRAEILLTLTSSYQLLALGLTAAGLVIAASTSIPGIGKPYWLGLAPLVFYALLWTQLRYEYVVFNMSNHIIEHVAPAIRLRLQQLQRSSDCQLSVALSWESAGRRPTFSREPWLVALEAARFAVPLLFAGFTFIGYLLVIQASPKYSFDWRVDAPLAALNALLFIFSTYSAVRLRGLLQCDHDAHERNVAAR
jgi:hypothetical protein